MKVLLQIKREQIGWCYFVKAVKFVFFLRCMNWCMLHILGSGNLAQQILYRECSTEIGRDRNTSTVVHSQNVCEGQIGYH